jgi:hypothetical protein
MFILQGLFNSGPLTILCERLFIAITQSINTWRDVEDIKSAQSWVFYSCDFHLISQILINKIDLLFEVFLKAFVHIGVFLFILIKFMRISDRTLRR